MLVIETSLVKIMLVINPESKKKCFFNTLVYFFVKCSAYTFLNDEALNHIIPFAGYVSTERKELLNPVIQFLIGIK